jgi:hypothetical protein
VAAGKLFDAELRIRRADGVYRRFTTQRRADPRRPGHDHRVARDRERHRHAQERLRASAPFVHLGDDARVRGPVAEGLLGRVPLRDVKNRRASSSSASKNQRPLSSTLEAIAETFSRTRSTYARRASGLATNAEVKMVAYAMKPAHKKELLDRYLAIGDS